MSNNALSIQTTEEGKDIPLMALYVAKSLTALLDVDGAVALGGGNEPERRHLATMLRENLQNVGLTPGDVHGLMHHIMEGNRQEFVVDAARKQGGADHILLPVNAQFAVASDPESIEIADRMISEQSTTFNPVYAEHLAHLSNNIGLLSYNTVESDSVPTPYLLGKRSSETSYGQFDPSFSAALEDSLNKISLTEMNDVSLPSPTELRLIMIKLKAHSTSTFRDSPERFMKSLFDKLETNLSIPLKDDKGDPSDTLNIRTFYGDDVFNYIYSQTLVPNATESLSLPIQNSGSTDGAQHILNWYDVYEEMRHVFNRSNTYKLSGDIPKPTKAEVMSLLAAFDHVLATLPQVKSIRSIDATPAHQAYIDRVMDRLKEVTRQYRSEVADTYANPRDLDPYMILPHADAHWKENHMPSIQLHAAVTNAWKSRLTDALSGSNPYVSDVHRLNYARNSSDLFTFATEDEAHEFIAKSTVFDTNYSAVSLHVSKNNYERLKPEISPDYAILEVALHRMDTDDLPLGQRAQVILDTAKQMGVYLPEVIKNNVSTVIARYPYQVPLDNLLSMAFNSVPRNEMDKVIEEIKAGRPVVERTEPAQDIQSDNRPMERPSLRR